MALWNDLIPRLHRPRAVVADRPPTVTGGPSTSHPTQPSSVSPSAEPAMERDGARSELTNAMSAVGQERKSHDRKSHDVQHDSDVIDDEEGGSNNDDNDSDDDDDDAATVSFSLALTVGCILLLLNIVVFVGTMCQWPRLRRRRRRRRKQRHAAALAALTSHPVDNRKLDGSGGGGSETVSSTLRCSSDAVTEETRLTLACGDDRGSHGATASACSPDCYCTRQHDGVLNFCDGRCAPATLNADVGASLTPDRLTADNITQSNHVFSRNQFTTV